MPITAVLYKKPHEVVFSGSPVIFGFAIGGYTDAEKKSDIRLAIAVKIETIYNSGSYTAVRQESFYPDNKGIIDLDVQTLIHAYLQYYTPRLNLAIPVLANGQQKRFKLSYTLIKDNLPVGTTADTTPFMAIKGGIAYQEWHPSEYFTAYMVNNKPPLSFFNPIENIRPAENRFLHFLAPETGMDPLTITFTLKHNLSNVAVTHILPDIYAYSKWDIFILPSGFNQNNLQALLPVGAICISYTIQVMRAAQVIVAPVTYVLDQRNFYDTSEIIFRNSVGGLETITLRGQIDMEAEYTQQQAQRTLAPSWYANMVLQPQKIDSAPEESLKFKGDTGFLSRNYCDKLRDLFLSEEKYQVLDNRLLPISILGKNVKFFGNKDNLISLAIEWQQAYTNSHYTPAGLLPQTRSCPALSFLMVVQISKTQLQVIYAAPPPYDRVAFEFNTGVDTQYFTYYKNSDSVIQIFTNPGNGVYSYRARVICDENADPIDAGPWTGSTVSVLANSMPQVADTYFGLAPGFSTPQLLLGNVLDNASDPDGDAIEVVPESGSTLAFGSYSINAAGRVTYTPPAVSYSGTDQFVYRIREVGALGSITGTAFIAVATGTTLAIYVKLVETDQAISVSGIVTNYTAKRWLHFYSDPAGTLPVDVTGLGLSINFRRVQATIGGSTGGDGIHDTVINPSGVNHLAFDGVVKYVVNNAFPFPIITVTQTHSILSGTGYTPI